MCAARISKKDVKGIALERIHRLFELAGEAFSRGEKDYAGELVSKARKLSTKNNVTIPRELKYRFCRKCGAYWFPGKSVRVRMIEGKIVYKCECGAEKSKLVKKRGRKGKRG